MNRGWLARFLMKRVSKETTPGQDTRQPASRSQENIKAFFSYPRKHAAVVRDFHTFSSIFGSGHFLDERSIPLGADFPDAIQTAIAESDVFVLFWCACASDSEWVSRELNLALEKKKKIVPILMGEFPLPASIARANGQKLSNEVCEQNAFGARFGAHLFRDKYADMSAESRSAMLRQLERILILEAA